MQGPGNLARGRGARRSVEFGGAAKSAFLASMLAIGGSSAALAQSGGVDAVADNTAQRQTASVLLSDPTAAGALHRTTGFVSPSTALEVAIANAAPKSAPWAQVYAKSGFKPIWLTEPTGGRVDLAKAEALIAAARTGVDHALPIAVYGLEKLEADIASLRQGGSTEDLAAFEIAMTQLFLRVSRDLSSGALEPRSILKTMDVSPPRLEQKSILARAAGWRAEYTQAAIEALAPQTADYNSLKKLYAELLAKREAGGWGAPVPRGRTLRPLDQGKRVTALRTRLIGMGFMPPETPELIDPDTGRTVFGPAMEAAVRSFQQQKGLKPDGLVGAATLASLNSSLDERIGLVAVNLERARWYNKDLGQRHIIVNIPAFQVQVIENGAPIFQTRVVVGKRQHQTPEFSDEMSHVVVNPYWHVPYSIATEEMLPKLRNNPGALGGTYEIRDSSGYRIDPWSVDWWALSKREFPFSIRQRPGSRNALGSVKFIFPNKHAVYLHDTPAKSLFQRIVRAYSHGCVRVADPVGLAEVLLGAQHSDPLGYFYELRARRREIQVPLKKKVPVYLTYRTVWVDKNGDVQYRDDVYGRDKVIYNVLKKMGLS